MNIQDLTTTLTGTSNTNGWDAVCAINVASINQLFMNWYLNDGPTNPDTPVRFLFTSGNSNDDYYILDVILGPPEISFSANGAPQAALLQMIIVQGMLLQFNPATGTIMNALILQPDTASLSGNLDFSKAPGKATLGNVVLDLSAGAYQPSIAGIGATSLLATTLGAAIQNYFKNNAAVLELGGVTTAVVSKYLQPQSFEFIVQANPEQPGDGCVLLLIQTTSAAGPYDPLPAYPIPDGYTAALLVSNNILFNGLFLDQLNTQANSVGVTFQSSQVNGLYQLQITSGEVSLGVVYVDQNTWTSNGKFEHIWSTGHEETPVSIPFTGYTLAPVNGKLNCSFNYNWKQGWAYIPDIGPGPIYPGMAYNTAGTTLTYNNNAPVTISQPSNCIVTFPWPTAPAVANSKIPNWSAVDPSGALSSSVASNMGPVFTALSNVGGVNTFALQNLLFYPNQTLNLATGSLPGDLVLTGSTLPPLAISPAMQYLAPGASPVQFTASLGGVPENNVLWEIKPRNAGTISATGLYTPPASIVQPVAVSIMATSGSDSGNALVILYEPQPSNGLTVSPASIALTAGQQYNFEVQDANGNNVDVTWQLDPASPKGGSISNVFGNWTYTAPAAVNSPLQVQLTATSTSNTSEFGTATVQLMPAEVIAIQASLSQISAGQSTVLTATLPAGVEDIAWIVSPAGFGIIGLSTNVTQLTYTAPASVDSQVYVQFVAYSVGQNACLGLCSVLVES